MLRFIMFVVVLLVLGGGSVARSQSTDEVKRLKEQIELLQAKLEAATLKIEKLEKELAASRAGKQGADGSNAQPTYLMKIRSNGLSGGDTEVKFVLEKLNRQNQTYTFDFTATLVKGELRRGPIEFGFFIGIDQDGNRHEGRVNVGRQKGIFGVKISPMADGPIKFSVPVTFPDTVVSFRKLQFVNGTLKSYTPVIEFEKLALPE